MGWSLKDIGGFVSSAATGGAWSTDGKGFMQGGSGMLEYVPDGVKDYVPGIGDARAQDRANEANLAESALNRQFQKEMSNTAYQRAMDDMRKAGLNPMLAISQGGASTPSGSTATVQAAPKTGLVDKGLQALTGLGSLQNQTTGLQQQQTMNESAIKLNASTAAKNLADAERTRLEVIKQKKYEPLNSAAGRVTEKIGNGMNKILDLFETSSKQKAKRWDDAMKKIKVLGPASAKENALFDKFRQNMKKP